MNHEEPLTLFIICLHSGNAPETCRSRSRAFFVMSWTAHASDLTSDKILAFVLASIRLASNENHVKKG